MDDRRSRLVLELTRRFSAQPERLFAALTEPSALATWWGPSGFTTPAIELDLRVGGRYRFSMRPPGGDVFHLAGKFVVIEPPRRLSYTFRWEEPDPDDRETLVDLSLEAVGGGTSVSLAQGDFATEERLALHRSGWTESFARLEEFIAG